jgi:hypothetical protein
VAGDASASMQVAIETATIIASLMTALIKADLTFFNHKPLRPPIVPKVRPLLSFSFSISFVFLSFLLIYSFIVDNRRRVERGYVREGQRRHVACLGPLSALPEEGEEQIPHLRHRRGCVSFRGLFSFKYYIMLYLFII